MTNHKSDRPAVLVVGAGAIGALYGSVLARQGARVSVVCRSDHDAVARSGFTIRSKTLGDHVFRPERVVKSVADYGPGADYLILATKVIERMDRVALIRPAVGTRTAVVLIQNGVDIEPEIEQAFPQNEILSCLAFVGVSRVARGQIWHQSYGHLVLGKYPCGASPAAQRLAGLWEAGGIACNVTDDVVTARWLKTVWNAVFNPLSIQGGGLTTEQMLSGEEAESFVRASMEEVCRVAGAIGHPLPPETVENNIAPTRLMPPYLTSMAIDYEHGRPIEIEAILGNVVRAARRAGVAIPRLEALYAITKMVERKARHADMKAAVSA